MTTLKGSRPLIAGKYKDILYICLGVLYIENVNCKMVYVIIKFDFNKHIVIENEIVREFWLLIV